MLLNSFWQRLSGKSGFKSGEGTQVKVVALMRWEWQAGDQEKYWQGWQWDGKPGAEHDSTELAVGRKARSGS